MIWNETHTFPHLYLGGSLLLMDLIGKALSSPCLSLQRHIPHGKESTLMPMDHSAVILRDTGWDIGWSCSYSSGGTWAGESSGTWSQTAERARLACCKGEVVTVLMPWLDQAPALPGPCLLENHEILDCQPGRILESNTIIGQMRKLRIHICKRDTMAIRGRIRTGTWVYCSPGVAFLWRLSRILKACNNRELQRSSNSDFIQKIGTF